VPLEDLRSDAHDGLLEALPERERQVLERHCVDGKGWGLARAGRVVFRRKFRCKFRCRRLRRSRRHFARSSRMRLEVVDFSAWVDGFARVVWMPTIVIIVARYRWSYGVWFVCFGCASSCVGYVGPNCGRFGHRWRFAAEGDVADERGVHPIRENTPPRLAAARQAI
jgi:hypothetical protein